MPSCTVRKHFIKPINGAFHVAAHGFSPFIPFTPPSASLSLPLFPPLLKALLDSRSPMLPYKATALVLSETDIESRRPNEAQIANQTLPRRDGQADASAINRSSSSATALFSFFFFFTPPPHLSCNVSIFPSFPPSLPLLCVIAAHVTFQLGSVLASPRHISIQNKRRSNWNFFDTFLCRFFRSYHQASYIR